MALHLVKVTPMPPGQFPYQQPAPLARYFPGDCDFWTQVDHVSQYRSANKLDRPGKEEVAQDISLYTCQRLGGDKRFCREADAQLYAGTAPAAVRVVKQKSGGCCGAHVK